MTIQENSYLPNPLDPGTRTLQYTVPNHSAPDQTGLHPRGAAAHAPLGVKEASEHRQLRPAPRRITAGEPVR